MCDCCFAKWFCFKTDLNEANRNLFNYKSEKLLALVMERRNQKCTKHHRKTLGIFRSRFEEEETTSHVVDMLLFIVGLL